MTIVDVDELFEGELVLEVPDAEAEYHRKMPGAYDAVGDHCSK